MKQQKNTTKNWVVNVSFELRFHHKKLCAGLGHLRDILKKLKYPINLANDFTMVMYVKKG